MGQPGGGNDRVVLFVEFVSDDGRMADQASVECARGRAKGFRAIQELLCRTTGSPNRLENTRGAPSGKIADRVTLTATLDRADQLEANATHLRPESGHFLGRHVWKQDGPVLLK